MPSPCRKEGINDPLANPFWDSGASVFYSNSDVYACIMMNSSGMDCKEFVGIVFGISSVERIDGVHYQVDDDLLNLLAPVSYVGKILRHI